MIFIIMSNKFYDRKKLKWFRKKMYVKGVIKTFSKRTEEIKIT
jgi:hypothetical protein